MLHVIGADNLIKPWRETNRLDALLKLQARARGNNTTLTSAVPQLGYHLGDAVVHRDFVQPVIRQRFPASHDRLDLLGWNA